MIKRIIQIVTAVGIVCLMAGCEIKPVAKSTVGNDLNSLTDQLGDQLSEFEKVLEE